MLHQHKFQPEPVPLVAWVSVGVHVALAVIGLFALIGHFIALKRRRDTSSEDESQGPEIDNRKSLGSKGLVWRSTVKAAAKERNMTNRRTNASGREALRRVDAAVVDSRDVNSNFETNSEVADTIASSYSRTSFSESK